MARKQSTASRLSSLDVSLSSGEVIGVCKIKSKDLWFRIMIYVVSGHVLQWTWPDLTTPSRSSQNHRHFSSFSFWTWDFPSSSLDPDSKNRPCYAPIRIWTQQEVVCNHVHVSAPLSTIFYPSVCYESLLLYWICKKSLLFQCFFEVEESELKQGKLSILQVGRVCSITLWIIHLILTQFDFQAKNMRRNGGP